MMGVASGARIFAPVLIDETAGRGREALERYVLDVLFNPGNREGSRFRGEYLAWHDAESRAALRDDMLADAQSFTPDSIGWDRYDHDHGITYAGRLGGFYTTISFASGDEPRISLDLD